MQLYKTYSPNHSTYIYNSTFYDVVKESCNWTVFEMCEDAPAGFRLFTAPSQQEALIRLALKQPEKEPVFPVMLDDLSSCEMSISLKPLTWIRSNIFTNILNTVKTNIKYDGPVLLVDKIDYLNNKCHFYLHR